jgi:lipoate-protein ligase A
VTRERDAACPLGDEGKPEASFLPAPIRLLDFTFDRPALNLAFDEVLLDSLETGRAGNALWFWEGASPFVVLGVSQVLAAEVHEEACEAAGVPIFRRCSAGGCVLQGHGCLNYSLVLAYDDFPTIRTIRKSYCFILGRIAEGLKRRGLEARHQGISDLAVDDLKFSGNAQRRRRKGILHHGTLLYDFDLSLLPMYLREPRDRPDYRGRRDHLGFVRNIPVSEEELKTAVREAFAVPNQIEGPQPEELDHAHRLAEEKYESLFWIRRR